jgi:hypothetical protein
VAERAMGAPLPFPFARLCRHRASALFKLRLAVVPGLAH